MDVYVMHSARFLDVRLASDTANRHCGGPLHTVLGSMLNARVKEMRRVHGKVQALHAVG